jgi:hypothetical protein
VNRVVAAWDGIIGNRRGEQKSRQFLFKLQNSCYTSIHSPDRKFASVYVRLFAFAWAALAGERAVLASSAATPHFPRLKGEHPFAGRLAFD